MEYSQEYCLRWGSYHEQLTESLRFLLDRGLLVDVTIACDGKSIKAHRAILSACSSYFQNLFEENSHPHPIVILKDVKFEELEALVHFMYHGEVTMNNDSLAGFLRTAETLRIRGLTGSTLPTRFSKNYNNVPEDCNSNETSPNTGEDMDSDVDQLAMKIKTEPEVSFHSSSVCNSSKADIASSLTESQNADNTRLNTCTSDKPASNESPYSNRESTFKSLSSLEGLSHLIMPGVKDDLSLSNQYGIKGPGPSMIARTTFRHRVMWNQEQLLQLEAWYRADRYPSGQTMRDYANILAAMSPSDTTPSRQNVDYWFQNRRRKDSHPDVVQQREKKKFAKTLWQLQEQRKQNGS